MLLENSKVGIQMAARIVDTPCNEMNTDAFLNEVNFFLDISLKDLENYYVWLSYYPWSNQFYILQIRTVGQHLGIVPTIIRDQELKERGFGGIYGVGQGALHPPALAVLSHEPIGATQTIAWVGKGIVYDTGGLSIKVHILLLLHLRSNVWNHRLYWQT